MSLYALKPRFQSLLRPCVRMLHDAGVTANQVTVFAGGISVALGIAVSINADERGWFLLLPAWFLMRMALNAIDGMLAREFGQASHLGAYLNELADVISDAALYLPFAFLPDVPGTLVALTVVLALMSEMAGVLGCSLGASRRYDGPMGKSDRAFVFGALGLIVGFDIGPGPWSTAVLVVIDVLIALTIVNRVRRGTAEANAQGRGR